MTDWFWPALAAKMATSAAVVVCASILVEGSGPLVGALIATLPISAGPAYAFLAAEHGDAFVAQSSLVSLGVNAATPALVVVYAVLARRRSLAASLGAGLATWAGIVSLVQAAGFGFASLLALNAAGYAAAMGLVRRLPVDAVPRRPERLWWDLPLRAALVMAVVATVVIVGRVLSPRAAGIAALSPIALISLALVLHPRIGGPATAAMFVHTLPGLVGFGCGVAVIHLAAMPLGVWPALLLALGVCVAWNLGLAALHHARPAPHPR